MRSRFRCWAIIAQIMLSTITAFAAPATWVVALDKAQDSGDPLVLVLAEREGALTGEVYLSKSSYSAVSADVSKLTRTDNTLKGDVTVALAADKSGSYTLDATVKDNIVTGTYKGKTGDTKVAGAVIWGADLLPLGQANYTPSPKFPIGWRGDGSGRFPGATPVTDWNLKTQKNVIWQTKLPYFSCSGPIVVGDKIFTTGEPDLLICVDAKTGKELWRRHNALFMEKIEEKERERLYKNCGKLLEIAEAWQRTPGEFNGKPNGDIGDPCSMLWIPTNDGRKTAIEAGVQARAAKEGLDLVKIRAMYAEVGSGYKDMPTKLPKGKALLNSRLYTWTGNTPATPASDGKYVVTKVASENGWGYVVCYDLEGNRQWSYDTGLTGVWGAPFDSPLIMGDKIIVQSLRDPAERKDRGLAALDIKTGKRLWYQTVKDKGSGSATPNAWVIDGVPTVQYIDKVYLPEDGTVLCDMSTLAAGDLDTPVVDANRIFFRRATGPPIECSSIVIKATWKTKGKELLCERVWQTPWKDTPTAKAVPVLCSNWVRGSSILLGDWVFVSTNHPTPALFAYNMTGPPEKPEWNNLVRPDKSLLVRPERGGPLYGPPSEDDMSVVMGGQYLFAAPSTWPSQFVIVKYTPAAKKITDLKFVSAPFVDAAMMGSAFFQGDRTYMRDFRYLYCFGDTSERDKLVVAAKNKEVK
ncbi:MAG: PQQ-binding-like beta-propeller repeat protein [bacterium]